MALVDTRWYHHEPTLPYEMPPLGSADWHPIWDVTYTDQYTPRTYAMIAGPVDHADGGFDLAGLYQPDGQSTPYYQLAFILVTMNVAHIHATLSAVRGAWPGYEGSSKLNAYIHFQLRKYDPRTGNITELGSITDDVELGVSTTREYSRYVGPANFTDHVFNNGDHIILELGIWCNVSKDVGSWAYINIRDNIDWGGPPYDYPESDGTQTEFKNTWFETGDEILERPPWYGSTQGYLWTTINNGIWYPDIQVMNGWDSDPYTQDWWRQPPP